MDRAAMEDRTRAASRASTRHRAGWPRPEEGHTHRPTVIRKSAKDCGAPTPLQLYFREIRDDALLTAAEERELAEAIARGDSAARSRMIRANLRLVVTIARGFVGRGIALDDLIGEGNLGLMRAAKEFDPRFGTRFSTYAAYWIKEAIRRAVMNTTATIRVPAHLFRLMIRWRRAERTLCREAGRAPSFEEVASYLRLSETQMSLVAHARKAAQLKLESSMAINAGQWSPDESIDRHEAPETSLEADDEYANLLRRMDRLDDRERSILAWRYGLEGERSLTLKEIGRRLGLCREWVRKIEVRALRKLAGDCCDEADGSWEKGRARRRCGSEAQAAAV